MSYSKVVSIPLPQGAPPAKGAVVNVVNVDDAKLYFHEEGGIWVLQVWTPDDEPVKRPKGKK